MIVDCIEVLIIKLFFSHPVWDNLSPSPPRHPLVKQMLNHEPTAGFQMAAD